MKKRLSAVLIFLGLSILPAAFADMDVPVSLQVALFYKIFEFDQTLADVKTPTVNLGIFYNPLDAGSVQAKEAIKSDFLKLGGVAISGKNILVEEITSPRQLGGMNIVYVTPGSDSFIQDIVHQCNEYGMLSISGVAKYISQGLTLVIIRENKKPKIVINGIALKGCGVKLSSKLLALAKII